MDLGIDGGSALVTAPSSGLGEASATALAREGVGVVINGRDGGRLAEVRAEIKEVAAGSAVTQQGDLTEKADIEAMVDRPVERGESDSYEVGMKARGESIPIGRVGDPMELGDTVAYLCSEQAGNVNGQSIVIDGGSGWVNL
ncbi:SDR family oxidoreductase [Halorubrum ejinorense]|uniref:SDR family oxidoreductase n=1 Tax=Halorubrum ejinorense TaxID=425309 RepID=A0AAV3SVG1_9EURY